MNKYLHHVCIQTNTYSDSVKFYLDILGFHLEEETPNFHGRHYNTWLSLDNFMIELQTPKYDEVFHEFDLENEGVAHICFYVEDILEEYKRIKNLGCNDFIVKNGEAVYTVGEGKLFKIVAPEGTIIEMRDNLEI